jgi:hypothetical protein
MPALQPVQLTHEPHIEPWHVSRAADINNVQAVDPVASLLAAKQPPHSTQSSSADSAAPKVTTALQTISLHRGQDGIFGCATPATAASAADDTAIGCAAADAPEHASEHQDAAHVSPAFQSLHDADWAPDDAASPMQQADTAAEDGPEADDIMQDLTEQQLTRAQSGSEQPQPSWAAHATELQPPDPASEPQGVDSMASSEVPAAWQQQLPEQHQQQKSQAGVNLGGSIDQHEQHENQEIRASTTSGSLVDADGRQGGAGPTAAASAPPLTVTPWAVGISDRGAADLPGPADPAAAIAEQTSGQHAAMPVKALNDGAANAESQRPDSSAYEQLFETLDSPAPEQAGTLVSRAPQASDTGAHSWQSEPAVQPGGPDAGTEWQQEAGDAQHTTAAGSVAIECDASSLSAPRHQLELGASDAAAEHTAQRRSWLERSDQEHEHADQLQQRAGLTSDSRFEPQPAAGQLDAQQQSGYVSPVEQQQQVEHYFLPQQPDAAAQHTSQLPMHAQSLASPHAELPAAAVQPSDGAAPAPASHTDWAAIDAASAGRATSAGSLCSSADSGSVASSRPDASDAEPAQVSTGM